jgi:hypothetical protein
MKRPSCPKCGGWLVPKGDAHDDTGAVVRSIACLNCGWRCWPWNGTKATPGGRVRSLGRTPGNRVAPSTRTK